LALLMLAGRWWDVVPAGLTWIVTHEVLGHPWQLAFLSAVAVFALGYSAQRTVGNLRQLHATSQEPLFVRVTPGEEDEGASQGQMHESTEGVTGEQEGHPGGEGESGAEESAASVHGSMKE
ncbi:MAG: hypothetical protein AAGE94_23915, partial [Acidobacteriota bacterium]